jgi:hypothetical protein
VVVRGRAEKGGKVVGEVKSGRGILVVEWVGKWCRWVFLVFSFVGR